ncbi:MAG: putative F420-dependent oxidoreductase [Phenylobacterium sp.]|nr:putative F420-dependent oxidoreductase [Phenylobacterium sp.]
MSAPVAVGLNLVWVKPEHMVEYARLAEALGFESVWAGEHVAVPARDDWWVGPEQEKHLRGPNPELKMPFAPKSPFLDPLVVLAHLAAATTRLRLGVGIYMLALRDPILAGRAITAVDVLSGGRLDLAVGLGWLPDEYRFTNNDWTARGRRTDEMIRCLRALFEQEEPEFHGEFFDFEPIGFEPKPLQRPRLPIHVGGGPGPAVRRAATLGDGWYGAPQLNATVREALKRAGREADPFHFSTISIGPMTPAELDGLAALGTQRVVVTPWPGKKVGEVGREGLADVERFARACGLTPAG